MSQEPIMTFVIQVDPNDMSDFMSPYGGGAGFVPFTGTVESKLFTGKTRPGACDVQIVNPAGYREMCARYLFEGTDKDGEACHLFVENKTYFTPDAKPGDAFGAVPTFITDSKALAPYLHTARFRSEGHGEGNTVYIKIFDIWEQPKD